MGNNNQPITPPEPPPEQQQEPPPQPPASDKDDRLLNYLALIARTIEQQSSSSSARDTGFWKSFQQPVVLAALITVLIGGIAATLVTSIIQWRAGEREFQQAILKARTDKQLAFYSEDLRQEQALITRVYGEVGLCIVASQRFIGLSGPDWHDRKPDAPMNEIINSFNKTKTKWKGEVLELGQLMGYYHSQPSQSKVVPAWNTTQAGVDAYLNCAQDWHREWGPGQKTPDPAKFKRACSEYYEPLATKLGELTLTLAGSRRSLLDIEVPQEPSPPSPSFWQSVKLAFSDGVRIAALIVVFLIRAIIALLPILVLVVLPGALITKIVARRVHRRRMHPDRGDREATGHETNLAKAPEVNQDPVS